MMGYTWGTVPGYTWYLVKHSPEPKRETLMLLGGVVWQGFLFGLGFFVLLLLFKGAAGRHIHKSSRGHNKDYKTALF